MAFIGCVNLKITNRPQGAYIGQASCRDVTLTQIGVVETCTEGVNTNNCQGLAIGY